MSKRVVILIAVIAALVLGLVARSMLGRRQLSDRDVLLGLVDQLAAAVERRDIREVRASIARDYRDAELRGYAEINQFLTLHLLRRSVVTVYTLGKDVSFADPRNAELRVKLVLTRGARVEKLADIFPDSARGTDLTLKLRKDDAWRITSASWTDLRWQQLVR